MHTINAYSGTLGLALSGGGTKGLAHAGVLQFLNEKKIIPTHIAGTSAGAIIGALYAGGQTPEQILNFFKSIYFFNWKHFTIKKPGFIDTEAFRLYFQTALGDLTLEDLSINLQITATDLVKGELMIFNEKTKIIDAVLASASFPGVLSPHVIDEKIYSDGGILNHFPTDLLRGQCKTVIGVYVNPIQKIQANNLDSIKAVTTRAFELLTAHSNETKMNLCDWLITPEALSKYSTFETSKSKMEEIFEIGYLAAKNSYSKINA